MRFKLRRLIVVLASLATVSVVVFINPANYQSSTPTYKNQTVHTSTLALDVLNQLEVKGRAPKTGYARDQFGSGWGEIGGCDTRNVILKRDLKQVVLKGCLVMSGLLHDPYTNKEISLVRGQNSNAVQIDHVVALSNAWVTGAQYFTAALRKQLANDPLELLAVDGAANQQKSDGDAATWLPSNKAFRCTYVARQVSVKYKYKLWVTASEKDAIAKILQACPDEPLLK